MLRTPCYALPPSRFCRSAFLSPDLWTTQGNNLEYYHLEKVLISLLQSMLNVLFPPEHLKMERPNPNRYARYAIYVLKTCFFTISAPIWVPMFVWMLSKHLLGPSCHRGWCRLKMITSEQYHEARWSTARSFGRLRLSMKRKAKAIQRKRTRERSSLERLPLEVKLKIWAMVYEDMTIHIVSHGKLVRHFVCPEELALRTGDLLDDPSYVQCRCLGSALEPSFDTPPDALAVKQRREKEPIGKRRLRVPGLHLTCREM